MSIRAKAIEAIAKACSTERADALIDALNLTCSSKLTKIAKMTDPTPNWKWDETHDGKPAGGFGHGYFKAATKRNPSNYRPFSRRDIERKMNKRYAANQYVDCHMVNLRISWFDASYDGAGETC